MTVLALRRRTHVERKVLLMLRDTGAALPSPTPRRSRRTEPQKPAPLAPAQSRYFSDLRQEAARQGLTVQPFETPYISQAELTLLSWLAEAQRITVPSTAPGDAGLTAALAGCAGLLDGLGLRLSPLSLYGARLRAHGPG